MKTIVDLPPNLLSSAREYAVKHSKSLDEVLEEALQLLFVDASPPGWESLFGAFEGSEENARIQAIIDDEFGQVNPGDWKQP
jgi:hypothetical protein